MGARRRIGLLCLGALLASGVGDTIRISYASDPIYEVEDGLELGDKEKGIILACQARAAAGQNLEVEA